MEPNRVKNKKSSNRRLWDGWDLRQKN